jgi:hypothetical protein
VMCHDLINYILDKLLKVYILEEFLVVIMHPLIAIKLWTEKA